MVSPGAILAPPIQLVRTGLPDDWAYGFKLSATAAGSVVTDDVPEGALAVARAKQENVERYAEQREARLDSEER